MLGGRLDAAGLEITAGETVLGTARFASIEEMVHTEVESAPLVDRIGDEVYRRIREESFDLLRRYQTEAGAEVPIESHLVIAHKPASSGD